MFLCHCLDSYDVKLNPKSGTPVVCFILLIVFEALWLTFKQNPQIYYVTSQEQPQRRNKNPLTAAMVSFTLFTH